MTAEQIKNIVKKEVTNKGYVFTQIDSKSTSSIYFTISSGHQTLSFRISDHATNKNIITIRTDKALKEEQLISFVRNRMNDLARRQLKGFWRTY